MATPPTPSRKILEGIIAVNKPQWASSAGVLRDLQEHFAKSSVFQPWLEAQRREMMTSHSKQKHIDRLKVKLGHGGTLDPMATGVLIVGVGKGTKCLQRFLECTKTYECVVLFGAATDSYDAVGKVVSKAPYAHVTKEMVEEKLAQFRGNIMQKPSVFSALKVDGKKMYEYAREGKDIPEVAARPVQVKEMELVEWLEPGTHEYTWPKEEADETEREGAEKLLGIRIKDASTYARNASRNNKKRSRSPETDQGESAGDQPKRPRTDSGPAMSCALTAEEPNKTTTTTTRQEGPAAASATEAPTAPEEISSETVEQSSPRPPAARLRMAVSSGFYVRSLCHDLGLACSSLGLMSSLIRSRQGGYTLGQNVVEFDDFAKGPEVWEPQVQKHLEEFMETEGWEAEELESKEVWEANKGERRREEDRERSYRGAGGWKGKDGGGWKGKKGGRGNNSSSQGMHGNSGGGRRWE
ncbi:pseudouridine synthase pus4 [Pleosporales sp. CAS-2024a]